MSWNVGYNLCISAGIPYTCMSMQVRMTIIDTTTVDIFMARLGCSNLFTNHYTYSWENMEFHTTIYLPIYNYSIYELNKYSPQISIYQKIGLTAARFNLLHVKWRKILRISHKQIHYNYWNETYSQFTPLFWFLYNINNPKYSNEIFPVSKLPWLAKTLLLVLLLDLANGMKHNHEGTPEIIHMN
jgi:hypothetical protein